MKKNLILVLILVGVALAGVAITFSLSSQEDGLEEKITIVTSFYPMYVATENLVDGIEHIELVNLTENQTGCLHDYQLTTSDMRKLENANVFIMNGGGMEGFVEEIAASYPNLTIIDASKDIEMLESEGNGHHHDGDEDDAEDGHVHAEETNAHVWLNPDLYDKQIENIAEGLAEVDKKHAKTIKNNEQVYLSALESVKFNMNEQLSNIQNKQVIIFHDAFAYLAQYLGLDVAYEVDMDGDSGLSAGDIKEVIDEINEHDIKVLFTEQQFSENIADSIAKETDAKVYVINSLVTGDMQKNAYINGMNENIGVLKEALS